MDDDANDGGNADDNDNDDYHDNGGNADDNGSDNHYDRLGKNTGNSLFSSSPTRDWERTSGKVTGV